MDAKTEHSLKAKNKSLAALLRETILNLESVAERADSAIKRAREKLN